MKRPVYRSLDRPASFFGIKGRFFIVLGAGLIAGLPLALIVGQIMGMIIGFALLLIILTGFYLYTVHLQNTISEKNFMKTLAKLRLPAAYKVQPKHIRNIWKGFNLPNSHDSKS